MAIQIQGNGGTVAEVGGTGFRALRVEARPLDPGALGAYAISVLSGTMAAGLAANSEIFQFRWSDATRLCAVQRVVLEGLGGSATAFTAGFAKVDLLAARGFSVDGTGGTTATTTTNNMKMRTSMGTSLITTAASIRVASTAALGLGTKTLDAQPMSTFPFSVGVGVSTQYASNVIMYGDHPSTTHPLILATNEGFVLRATVPATGTWQFSVRVIWTEVAAY